MQKIFWRKEESKLITRNFSFLVYVDLHWHSEMIWDENKKKRDARWCWGRKLKKMPQRKVQEPALKILSLTFLVPFFSAVASNGCWLHVVVVSVETVAQFYPGPSRLRCTVCPLHNFARQGRPSTFADQQLPRRECLLQVHLFHLLVSEGELPKHTTRLLRICERVWAQDWMAVQHAKCRLPGARRPAVVSFVHSWRHGALHRPLLCPRRRLVSVLGCLQRVLLRPRRQTAHQPISSANKHSVQESVWTETEGVQQDTSKDGSGKSLLVSFLQGPVWILNRLLWTEAHVEVLNIHVSFYLS